MRFLNFGIYLLSYFYTVISLFLGKLHEPSHSTSAHAYGADEQALSVQTLSEKGELEQAAHRDDLEAAQEWMANAGEAPVMQARYPSALGTSSGLGARFSEVLAQVPQSRPMRILVTCLQSSGCTMFAKLLGQVEDTAAFLDTHIYVPPAKFPKPNDLQTNGARFIVLKTTIQGREIVEPTERLQQIKTQFRPDRAILFVRSPSQNLAHLREHLDARMDLRCEPKPIGEFGYASRCGTPQNKLRALEVLWESREDIFDAVVSYADLVGDAATRNEVVKTLNLMGIPLSIEHFAMQKSTSTVEQYARQRMGNATFAWSTGDVADGPIKADHVPPNFTVEDTEGFDKTLRRACPRLLASMDSFKSTIVRAKSPLDSDALSWFKVRAGDSSQVVVLFVNADYADTLLNWFGVGKRQGSLVSNYAVVCLDDVTEALLRAHGEECFPAHPHFTNRLDGSLVALGPLWMLRIRILSALLEHGLDVILTDSDALWLQNPLPAINEIISVSGADVVSSRGRSPIVLAKQWGATACMGFIVFRATNPTRLLMREMLLFARKTMIYDDQILMNTVLYNVGLQFSKTLTLEDSAEVDIGVTNQGGGFTTKVAFLPHNKYMRFCEKGLKDVVIAHCESDDNYGSTGQAKQDGLAYFGLWVLPKRWPNLVESKRGLFDPWISGLLQNKLVSN